MARPSGNGLDTELHLILAIGPRDRQGHLPSTLCSETPQQSMSEPETKGYVSLILYVKPAPPPTLLSLLELYVESQLTSDT